MFKGFTKELQQAITRYNQNSKKNFIFASCDLNYSSDRQQNEYKYDIVDEELQTELGKIITAGGGTLSNPKGINFSNRWEELPTLCYDLKYRGIKNYDCWIIISKKWLRETQKNNTSRIIKIPEDELYCHDIKTASAGQLLDKLSGKIVTYYREKWIKKEEAIKIESAEKTAQNKKNSEILAARQKAHQKIAQLISETGLDLQNAPIDWLDILPEWCHCEVSGNIIQNSRLFMQHLDYCIWREESEFTDFQNKAVAAIVKLIEEDEEKFGNYKNQSFKKLLSSPPRKKGLMRAS